jgi:hypothetical protein
MTRNTDSLDDSGYSLGLFRASDLVETITAVNRSVAARFEWNFRLLATLGAYGREHLSWSSSTGATATLSFPCLTALGAALWFILQATSGIEFLLSRREGEGCSAFDALERFVLETH